MITDDRRYLTFDFRFTQLKTITTIAEYFFVIGSIFFVILFFLVFVKAHKIAEQKKEKDEKLTAHKERLTTRIIRLI